MGFARMTQAVAGSPGAIDDASVMDVDAVAAALEVDLETGLSAQEAARRLAQNGPNELRAAPRAPAWRRVLAQFQDPLIYLLLAAVAIALLAWWVEGHVGWPVDAIVIAAVVLLNAVIGHVQEAKAQNAVAALARMTAATASRSACQAPRSSAATCSCWPRATPSAPTRACFRPRACACRRRR
jgi:P-type Ca2+ transporter type 2C